MKHRLYSKMTAIIVVISMLLTGTILPVAATAVPEPVSPTSNVEINDATVTNDDLFISDETILRADDSSIAEDSMILHYVDSAQFDDARHTMRLYELEDLNTYVFQNADGTRTVYFLDENVKFVNGEGKTVEKDLSLVANKQGYSIAQSNIGLTIPNDPSHGISLDYLGYTVTITPITGNTDITTVKKDNSVLYTGIFSTNASLKYTPLLSGVKEDILLSSYIPNASYSFTINTDGLYLCENDGKYFLAESAAGKPLFYLGDVITYDAIGKPSEGTMTVKTISEGAEYTVTVAADEAFLSDPTTVYPVTIDPSITVSDNTHGANAIEDSPIYAGYPNRNFGTYLYNPVGTPDSTFGIGRTVVRLNGLINSNEYTSISASQITKVTFNAKESSGTSSQYINLYPLTGNTTWTESTVTWNNIGSYTTSVNYGASMNNGRWTEFDITGLVKAWKNGTYSGNAGFILTNEKEANLKNFNSSECSTSANRPYVTMTYSTNISLNYMNASIVEGGTRTLIATTIPSGQPVTWSTSDSTIATVSTSGVVTAKKAGIVTIKAQIDNGNGITSSASCTVYVYLPNGVYYFNNVSNNYRIEFVDSSSYNENEPLTAWESDGTAPSERFRLFKTTYLGSGLYSIRSMLDNQMGWTRSGTKLVSTTIGTSDSSVPATAKWYIKYNGKGYYIYSQYGTSRTLTCPADIEDDWDILLSSYSSTNLMQCWNIRKISSSYRGIDIRAKTSSMSIGETYNFTATTYSTYEGEYSLPLRWKTDNSRIASVGNTTGVVTARNSGKIAITAYMYNYPSVTSTATLTVKPQTSPTSGIKSGSVYMIKNVSKGLYLNAYSPDKLTLASKNAMDGKQLWYVEWTGSAYKIYSMGIKATAPGSSESLLCGYTASNSPRIKAQTTYTSWTISYYNGYYYLVNNSSLYNGTSISANSTNNSVTNILLENENSYAQWSFEEIKTSTFNNYFTGSYNGQGSHIYIKISADSSLYKNNYVNVTNMGAVNKWNGLSSNVTIYDLDDTVPSSVNTFSIKYLGYTPSDPNNYGMTQAYKKVLWWYEEVYLNEDFDKVEIFINTTSASPFASETTDIVIEKVIAHELGHALKLAHPMEPNGLQSVANARNNYANNSCVLANMNQENPNLTSNLTASTPKWHDIINLKNKWGE